MILYLHIKSIFFNLITLEKSLNWLIRKRKFWKEKTIPIFCLMISWTQFLVSQIRQNGRVYVPYQEEWIAGPVDDIDVDWPEGCGCWPSKQSNLSAGPTCGFTVSRRGVHMAWLVTNRRATVSQVRRFHFVSPDSQCAAAVLRSRKFRRIDSIPRRSGTMVNNCASNFDKPPSQEERV